MQILNHHGKNAMLAVLIAATGLPASGALAQFRAEYGGEPKAAAEARQAEGDKDTKRTITITSDDKKHKYEVRIVNGELKLAKLDGKELGPERVRITAEAVVFLDEDGEKLHEFHLPAPPAPAAVPDAPRIFSGPAMIEMRDEEGRTFVTSGQIRLNAPKVMLGVNMSEPSAALRKQLKLGEEMEVILIERVIDGLPADKAGLEEFDVIVSIDGSEGANASMLTSTLAKKNPDDRLDLVVLRGGEKVSLTAKLAEYDPEKLGGSAGAPPSPSDIERGVIRLEHWGTVGRLSRELRQQAEDRILEILREHGTPDTDELRRRVDEHLKHLEEGVREGEKAFAQDRGGATPGEIGRRLRDQTYNRLADLFRDADMDEERIEEFEQQLRSTLKELEERVRDVQREDLERKAVDAMRNVERQMMEFRDGRLFVRSAEEVERREDQIRARRSLLERAMPDQQEIQSHMSELESRLAELESRLESQMSRFEQLLEENLECLVDRFERLMDRLEEDRE